MPPLQNILKVIRLRGSCKNSAAKLWWKIVEITLVEICRDWQENRDLDQMSRTCQDKHPTRSPISFALQELHSHKTPPPTYRSTSADLHPNPTWQGFCWAAIAMCSSMMASAQKRIPKTLPIEQSESCSTSPTHRISSLKESSAAPLPPSPWPLWQPVLASPIPHITCLESWTTPLMQSSPCDSAGAWLSGGALDIWSLRFYSIIFGVYYSILLTYLYMAPLAESQ